MFAGAVMITPGQELRTFDVFRESERRTASGRVTGNGAERLGEIRAVLAAAKPTESERWRQLGHPVTHKIIQQGTAPFPVKPGDSLQHGESRYFVQAQPYNPGGLNQWTIYYCEERGDV